MEKSDVQYAEEKLAQLKTDYQVAVVADWSDDSGNWKAGTWTKAELDKLHNAIALLANIMGENQISAHMAERRSRIASVFPRKERFPCGQLSMNSRMPGMQIMAGSYHARLRNIQADSAIRGYL